jgi:hypothetical protein
VGLGADEAWGFECKRSRASPLVSLSWPERQIELGVRPAPGVELEPLRAATRAWSRAPCSDLELVLLGVVPEMSSPEAMVAFVDAGWSGGSRPPDAVGLTTTTYDVRTGDIARGVVEINRERFELGAGETCAPAGPQPYDLQAVLTHELGHLLGLGHTRNLTGDARDPTMAPTIEPCETRKRTLEADDHAGLCTLYPERRPNGGCSAPVARTGPIRNRAFGCRTLPRKPASGSGAAGAGGLVLLLVGLGLRRWSCSRPRSAR